MVVLSWLAGWSSPCTSADIQPWPGNMSMIDLLSRNTFDRFLLPALTLVGWQAVWHHQAGVAILPKCLNRNGKPRPARCWICPSQPKVPGITLLRPRFTAPIAGIRCAHGYIRYRATCFCVAMPSAKASLACAIPHGTDPAYYGFCRLAFRFWRPAG